MGGGRRGVGGRLGEQLLRNYSCFASAVTSVAPAATSAALHFSAAADAAGDGRAPTADVVACAAPAAASGVSATAAPTAAGAGAAIATVSATAPFRLTPVDNH